eukprot:gene2386-2948_t
MGGGKKSRASTLNKNKQNAAIQQQKKKNVQLSLDELLDKGEEFASQGRFNEAIKYFTQAHKLLPNNTEIIDTIGELWLELGEIEKAKTHFLKSIETDPEDSAIKYMNLGQLLGGDDAVKYYRKGIDIMESELKKLLSTQTQDQIQATTPKPLKQKLLNHKEEEEDEDDDEEEEMMDEEEEEEDENPITVLRQQLSSGYCSLAELYLTDSCFDDNAEVECEKALIKAIESSPHSPEPYSMMASMKISQLKNQDALDLLNKSYSLWENADIDERPDYEYRYTVSLLFIELKQEKKAIDILEQLVTEQDNIAEVWYSLGVAYHQINEPLSSQDCLNTSKQLNSIAHDGVDKELNVKINQLLVKVDKEVSLLPPDALKDDSEDDEEMS